MDHVTIDGTQFALDALSDVAKQSMTNIQVVDAEISRLKNLLAIATMARSAYALALKDELKKISG